MGAGRAELQGLRRNADLAPGADFRRRDATAGASTPRYQAGRSTQAGRTPAVAWHNGDGLTGGTNVGDEARRTPEDEAWKNKVRSLDDTLKSLRDGGSKGKPKGKPAAPDKERNRGLF